MVKYLLGLVVGIDYKGRLSCLPIRLGQGHLV